MIAMLSGVSLLFIPVLFSWILMYGLWKHAPVYDLFVEGAKDGLRSALEILPFILAIFIGIESLTSSGAMAFLDQAAGPLFSALGIPEELTSLVLLRPVSGSGSLVLVEEILEEAGPDSFSGRAASVMAGSCETIFYVLAVYFGVTGVTHVRHSLIVGIVGYIAGVAASLFLCRVF